LLAALVAATVVLGAAPARSLASPMVYAVNMLTDESGAENPEACGESVEEGVPTLKSEKCSLREALEDAGRSGIYGASSLEVSLPAGLYTLTKGPLPLGNAKGKCAEQACEVVLVGAGAAATKINGSDTTRLLQSETGDANTEVRALTLEHGSAMNAGGAFSAPLDAGTLTVRESVLEHNFAKDSGGALSGANFELIESRVANNESGFGGAIRSVLGEVNISGSTFAQNTAQEQGGAVYDDGGSVNVVDSTIAENHAHQGSGVYLKAASLQLRFSTITANNATTPAIDGEEGDSVEMEGAILSADTNGECEHASLKTTGSNIVFGANTCSPVDGPAPLGIDPKLGPTTSAGVGLDYSLASGSPAINAAAGTCPNAVFGGSASRDQRGVPRPQGAACDLGAFEVASDAALTLSASPATVTLGAQQTLTATLTDPGSEAAQGVLVTFPIPPGATFVSASSGCSVSFGASPAATCPLGTLAASTSQAVSITIRPEHLGGLLETASLTTTSADYEPHDDSTTIATGVVAPIGSGTGSGPGTTPKGAASAKLIGSSFTVDSHGNLLVRVRCAGSSKGGCVTALDLFATSGLLPAVASAVRKALLYAHAHVTIAAGKTAFVHLRLSKAALKLLKKSHLLRVRALISLHGTVASVATTRHSVVLKPAKKHKH
jgi:uncharacterized repeat protein (TIGR01451 family)